jgi:hypothetical protein
MSVLFPAPRLYTFSQGEKMTTYTKTSKKWQIVNILGFMRWRAKENKFPQALYRQEPNFTYGHWNLNFISFPWLMKHYSSFDLCQQFKNAITIHSLQVIWKQTKEWACPVSHSLTAPSI